ncbi:amidohydrolase family protein [Xanthobacter flavus]|uniref:amidohydrolase family protein n=1 Tax=Xanthobacter flavus TaxID=281 RepID=UPI001AE4F77C|nr:aminocarboxymuconate-semialdehyde decarboxylase [Xanthobacter flavus]
MIVDVHAHTLSRDFLGELAREGAFGIETCPEGFRFAGYGPLDPLLFDMPGRLESLTRRNISLQLVSPPPRVVSHAGWAADGAFARRLNAQTLAAARDGGQRLGGLAVPPIAEPERCADAIRRALDEGHVGVALPTSAAGRPLDDPAFEDMWAECARQGCIVFMHPTSGVDRPAFGSFTMLQLVGWPSETALCVARLIFSGVLERHPGLKLVLAHGGGTLPMLAGRLDLAYEAPLYEANPACRANICRPPSHYLGQLYYDTVVAHPTVLDFLLNLVGPERVVFGTDFPFEIGDAEGAKALAALDQQSTEVRARVLAGGARLMGLA